MASTDTVTSRAREWAVASAIGALTLVLAVAAPGYFSAANLSDLLLANLSVLLVAVGMTLVIITGEIDISVGSMFAVCAVVSGVLSKSGMPVWIAAVAACLLGTAFGLMNGALVAYVGIPSIVVTLATMTALREGLRWATQGAWVQDLPPSFQWLGFSAAQFPVVATGVATNVLVVVGCTWAYARRERKRWSDLPAFALTFALTTAFFAADMALFQPRYLALFPRLLHPHWP